MIKKITSVILWLTFALSVLAQAPEPTKPPSTETIQTQPCWEKEVQVEVSVANRNCYEQFLQEVDRQIKAGAAEDAIENLEVIGVRFLKAIGLRKELAAEMVQEHFAELKLRNVPLPQREVAPLAPKKTLEEPPVFQGDNRDSMIPPHKRRNARADDTGFLASQAARDEIIKRRAEQIDLQNDIDWLEKVRRKDEDPAARQARKKLEEQEKQELKYTELLKEASVRSKVEGCKDPIFSFNQPADLDPHQMWVKLNAAALPPSRILGVPYSRQWIQIRIVNPMRASAVDIEFNDRYLTGVVVKNLCPGGRVTLYRQRVPGIDDNQMLISLNAIRSDGRMTQRSYTVSAWSRRRGQFPTWILPK